MSEGAALPGVDAVPLKSFLLVFLFTFTSSGDITTEKMVPMSLNGPEKLPPHPALARPWIQILPVTGAGRGLRRRAGRLSFLVGPGLP